MKQVQKQEQQQRPKGQVKNMRTDPCPWCLTNAGRTHGERKCYQLRRLALSPRAAQAEFAKTLTAAEREELRPRLKAEIRRLKALKEAANTAPA